ncbi:MAG TPA: glycosyltransferase family 9 protein [Ktedonobacterales bacterium]|nr:glycosyltransferase family 9 protein [Ktedonobacterales bacterium]
MSALAKDSLNTSPPAFFASLANRPARIAIVRALRLGDLLCAVPTFRAIRCALPRAHITLIGLPLAREFVRRCRFLDDYAEFPGFPGIADQPVDPKRTVAFLTITQHRRLDLAIQLHGSGVFSNPFTRLLGARHTIGFTRLGETDLGLDFAIPYPEKGREIDRLLALTHAFGAPDMGDEIELTILPEDEAALASHASIQRLFADGRPLFGIHPGASVATRRWAPERFAAVADTLAARHDAHVVILGTRTEHALCEAVRRRMRAAALNIAGQTSLGMVAALLARLQLLIGNDSGLAHLAVAVGTSVVVIFGAAQVETWEHHEPQRYRALSIAVPCRPCALNECPIGYQCLEGITVAAVVAEAEHLLHGESNSLQMAR